MTVVRRTRKSAQPSTSHEQANEFTLSSLKIAKPPFRKLKNLDIEFASRITLIAGHNGIGKSTILALVANGSGLTDYDFLTYTGKPFTGLLNEIIHIDYETEFLTHKANKTLSNPFLNYSINGASFSKRCGFTKRDVKNRDGSVRHEARVVPRNAVDAEHHDQKSGIVIGKASKVPIPTIYLGMTRMIPIGESDPEMVESSPDDSMEASDATFIKNFIDDVISASVSPGKGNAAIFTQGIKGTSKAAKHPSYSHSPKSISLGQDSLSSIATAFASFRKLEREWPEYPGGLLVIDELDAGFHPHAQQALITAIKTAAKKLRVQVVATTHSLCMIESIHPDNNIIQGNGIRMDSVIYIMDTIAPRAPQNLSYEQIKNDMMLTAPSSPPKPKKIDNTLKIYLEDAEADFFLKHLLTQKLKRKINSLTGRTLKAIPISVGCQNLQGLQKFDKHFKTVLIVVDADSSVTKGLKNVVKLPGGHDKSGNGYSPERTIYEFISELMKDDDNYPVTRQALEDLNVTRNQLHLHLLKGNTNISERESAKKWMRARLKAIQDWDLVGHWLREHADQVDAFEENLTAAAIATARLTS
ncbi:AAA family ATPase [Pseudomonas protegens]|uniref:AAA family ATPase n=1 Tax=Pseudomonas protegens TaxID=380021 RepID=UPI0027784ABF|nr:AAA family ATPase [Pseudomonas protegens]MDP9514685.1 AAA family ATPase [Pseudomonas protegens]